VLDRDAIHSLPFARGLIRREARLLRAASADAIWGFEDLEQELRLRLLQALDRYDPGRGSSEAFVAVVLGRAAAGIRRDRGRFKRTRRAVAPGAAEPTESVDSLDEAARDLRIDLLRAVGTLPDDLLLLAGQLLLRSLAEVARAQGVPRSSLVRRLERIRRHFEAAGVSP